MKFLLYVPKGWKPIKGALTAPIGFTWYSNDKSLWDPLYDCALCKDGDR